MTCHLINKAVTKENCIEALNQHAQALRKKAALSSFSENFGNRRRRILIWLLAPHLWKIGNFVIQLPVGLQI